MKNKILIAALLMLLSSVSGCRMALKLLKPDFFEGNGAYKAAQAVKNKVGAPFRVRTVEITEDTFKMTVEAPGNPRNIDEYNYVGVAAVGPNPLHFDSYDAKETDRLPFDEIDFTVVPQIIKNALEKIQVEGGKVTKIEFYTKVGNKFGWDVKVQGTRESASARADMQGNIVSTNLSQTSQAADYKVLNETELSKATEAIKEKLGVDVQISDLYINQTQIRFKAKNPQNDQEASDYIFGIDGLKHSSTPVFSTIMMKETVAFSEIKLADILILIQKAKEKLQLPNGEINSVTFQSMPVLVDKQVSPSLPKVTMKQVEFELRWTVSVKDGSGEKNVHLDKQLNEVPDIQK